jgi:predicted transcriptional regulator
MTNKQLRRKVKLLEFERDIQELRTCLSNLKRIEIEEQIKDLQELNLINGQNDRYSLN